MLKKSLLSSSYLVFFCAVLSITAIAQNLPGKSHNHEVPLDSAKKYIQNLQKDAMQMRTNGGMFNREGLEKVLGQKNCVGIRFYYAKMDDGTPTLVAVGVDSTGKDMTKGVLLEKIAPCPPYCNDTELLRK